MKNLLLALLSLMVFTGLARAAEPVFPARLLDFSAAKQMQEWQLARELHRPLPAEVTNFFQFARKGDYPALSNIVASCGAQLYAGAASSTNGTPAWLPFWQPMTEVESAYGAFTHGVKYPLAFGDGIIQSIPAGSIYFGGTDPGRMLVTALCESSVEGKPFFTLTQNALSDNRYMDYLRGMYGRRMVLPTTNEMQAAQDDYSADLQRRVNHDKEFPTGPRQVKPGEDYRMVEGKLQPSGPVAVMAIHARLVKVILEHNPKREFYLEESYPLDSLYPYLSPHGLIFKLDHEPLPQLTGAVLDADHVFWAKQCSSMLGDWLKPETSVRSVCAFAKTVHGLKDYSHFTGDREFVTNEFATKAFSKLRASIAGLYQWRLMQRPGRTERERLAAAADEAFRQAFAMCPNSPEALYRYVNFLLFQGRTDDAVLLASTAQELTPDNEQYNQLLKQLLNYQQQQGMKGAVPR